MGRFKYNPSIIIFAAVAALTGQQLHAQELDWAMLGGGQAYDRAQDVAVDAQSHTYAVGGFGASAHFDGHNLASQGGIDVFVARLSPSGSIEWIRSAGGTGDDEARGVALGPDGHVYVTGFFGGTAHFGSTTLTSVGRRDIFLAKYGRDGTVIWARSAGGPETPGPAFEDDFGSAVDVSPGGDVYVTGMFRGTATFDGQQLTSRGGQDIFVAQYDENGSLLWVRRAGGGHFQSDEGSDLVATSDGGVVVTGFFGGTAHFGPPSLVSAGSWDIFVAKYGSDGDVDWAKSAGGTGMDRGFGIDCDPDGNLYLTGYFSRTAHFGGLTATAPGVRDMFVARLNPTGDFVWTAQAGSPTLAVGHDIAVDPKGLVLASGTFKNRILHPEELFAEGARDALVVAFKQDGQEAWARSFGGREEDIGLGVALDRGDAYIVGSVGRDARFGDMEPIQYGGDDAYVANVYFGVQAPNLMYPPDGTEFMPTTLNLNWAVAERADRYDIQIATTSDFAEILLPFNTPGTAMRFVAPVAGHTYHWRVRGVDAGARGPWSPGSSFSVGTSGPLAAMPVSPADGEMGVDLNPIVRWLAAPEAVTHRLQLSLNMYFTSVILDERDILGDAFTVTELDPGTTYYWRIAGVGSDGTSTYSMTSMFTTTAAPGEVSLLEPADGATSVSPSVAFAWAATSGADSYELQISRDAAMTDLVITAQALSSTSHSLDTPLLYVETYYWRVRATNSAGDGPWSPIGSFTVAVGTDAKDDVPGQVSLESPVVFPNPVHDRASVRFTLETDTEFRLEVYDVLGRSTRVVKEATLPAGTHTIGLDSSRLPDGMYVIGLHTAEGRKNSRFLVLH